MKLVITGGYSGIGLELTKKLLHEGHEIALIIRNKHRVEAVKKYLSHYNKMHFFFGDLSIQADVHRVANEVKEHWPIIDGLFNNAGVLLDKNYFSPQNNEMHLEVNVLAPYLLTQALIKNLMKGQRPFIINTVTGGLHRQKALDLSHLIQPKKYVKLMGSYYQSKIALMLLMNQLSEEYKEIKILNVDPGALKTKMTGDSKAMPGFMKIIRAIFFQSPDKGAEKLYQAAFSEKFNRQSGVYISGNKLKPLQLVANKEDCRTLLAGIKDDMHHLHE
ncbi:MAG: SDR family NAD(P)-dependent oxidoreductase [Pseudomonadota bacterium]